MNSAYWEIVILDENDRRSAGIGDTCASGCNDLQQANAERIVACVNACEGVSNDQLPNVALLTEALQALLNMDVNGHALQDRLQFSDKGRALLKQARHALGVAL